MPSELLRLTNLDTSSLAGAMVVAFVVSAFLGYRIGRRRDRPVLGVVLGGLLTVVGLLALALMPTKEPTYY